ncbi:MAG: cobalamin biosynthesis protein CbiX [Chromatiaceae bacterium]|nr:MAG: cobalamin biosynthesis protein CbiX [Chromatiaceae bacterium]
MRQILLIDNGSRRPEPTQRLRRLASALAEAVGQPVQPLSLLHSSAVPAARLDGAPAALFEPWLRDAVTGGQRSFLAVPLFFGRSRGLAEFIPEQLSMLQQELGEVDLRVADVLCPLPAGEPRLVDILTDNLNAVVAQCPPVAPEAGPIEVVLVDHGSPSAEVTAVRRWLAAGLRERLVGADAPGALAARLKTPLGAAVTVTEAVMERRPGAAYDFNGPLLEDLLAARAAAGTPATIAVAMLFLAPGRHAGPGGDIEQICAAFRAQWPGGRICISPLVGDHSGLVDILAARVGAALADCD